MARRLTGGPGTGKKIIKYWEGFYYDYKGKVGDMLSYDISFYNQSGYFNITMEDDEIKSVTMDCGLYRPLGSYNDYALIDVARRILDL